MLNCKFEDLCCNIVKLDDEPVEDVERGANVLGVVLVGATLDGDNVWLILPVDDEIGVEDEEDEVDDDITVFNELFWTKVL